MDVNSVILNDKDNVATITIDIKSGFDVVFKRGDVLNRVTAVENIPIYHKISVKDIGKGELVYKYGQVIGAALCHIKEGQHVHIHNIASRCENSDAV